MSAAEGPAAPATRPATRAHLLFRAPTPWVALGLTLLAAAALSAVVVAFQPRRFLLDFLLVFAGPAVLAGVLTTPLVGALGGRLELHRGLLLSFLVLLIELPLAALWRLGVWVDPSGLPPVALLVPFLAAPALWFRQLGLYGVSRSSHARMLPASLLQPLLFLAGEFYLHPPGARTLEASATFLALAFVLAYVVVRASDRPIRREFQSSGVSLIRPLLDHVGLRDPDATRALEAFFLKTTVRADVRVDLIAVDRDGRTHATVALPAVHPGPFGALGASDLPRKLEAQLGPDAGVVLVPHTPSDHDLDLPSDAEVERIGAACRALRASARALAAPVSGPLVEPRAGSLARAQMVGGVALVVVSQAPAPTDDIAYSVADRIVREIAREGGPPVVLVDAHNSYVEGQGDIPYGSPVAERLRADVKAAIAAAQAAARPGPVEVGVAVRDGYSIGRDGIGPHGMRALAVRAGGSTSGYVLIDGNNLLMGERAPIVEALGRSVGAAEVLSTDNHVVHEVDGGINPLGERYPRSAMVHDARAVLDAAVADLGPSQVRFGTTTVEDVRVLGPGYTARLLTSLGDTFGMFTHMFTATFLLLLTSSFVVALLLR